MLPLTAGFFVRGVLASGKQNIAGVGQGAVVSTGFF